MSTRAEKKHANLKERKNLPEDFCLCSEPLSQRSDFTEERKRRETRREKYAFGFMASRLLPSKETQQQ